MVAAIVLLAMMLVGDGGDASLPSSEDGDATVTAASLPSDVDGEDGDASLPGSGFVASDVDGDATVTTAWLPSDVGPYDAGWRW